MLDNKNTSIIISIIGCVIAIGALMVKFGGDKARNEITHTKQEELTKTLNEINENGIWVKTTLVDHLKDDDKKEQKFIEDQKELKQMIIEQNRELIKALNK